MNTPPRPHPFADLIDLEIVERGDGTCRSAITLAPKHCNPHGVAHGAVIYAMADTGMGGALTSRLDENQICSTIEIKINYFRPAVSGRITCDTRVVSKGSRTAVMESDVTDDQGRHVARALGTFMIIDRPA